MPEKSGTNVYKMLREFQLRYYSAPLMTLAVESKGMIWTKNWRLHSCLSDRFLSLLLDTLESLEAMVNEIFGAIPNRYLLFLC